MDVSCAPNFIGDPTPTVTACDKPLTPYTVSGCRPMKCTSPTAEAKKDYVINETSLEKPSFAVSATCLKGGMAGEAVPCIFDGEPYTLKGCDEASCESPRRTEETGYSVSLSCHQIAMSVRIRFAFQLGVFEVRGRQALPILQGVCQLRHRLSRQGRGPPLPAGWRAFYLVGLRAEDLHEAGWGRDLGLRNHPAFRGDANLQRWCQALRPLRPLFSCLRTYDCMCFVCCFFDEFGRCKYGGNATVSVCKEHAQPYSVSGCLPPVCKAPRGEEGYVVCLGCRKFESRLGSPELHPSSHV